MATAKQTTPAAKKSAPAASKGAPAAAPAKKAAKAAAPAPAAKVEVKAAAAPARKVAAKPAAVVQPAAAAKKAAAPGKAAKPVAAAGKPIKSVFNKTTLNAHLAQQAGVEPKAVKAVLAALEATMLASINKKGLGAFTLPGLLKVTVLQVAAKKKRMGKDPFTGVERQFAAKPASVKIKTRALKKLKDAAA